MQGRTVAAIFVMACAVALSGETARAGAADFFKEMKQTVEKATANDDAPSGKNGAATGDPAKGKNGGIGESAGDALFSDEPFDPADPDDLKTSFETGDYIYALLRPGKSWKDIYGKSDGIELMVQMHIDGERVSGAYVTLKSAAVAGLDYLVLDIAPEPGDMTAYGNPDIHYATFGEDKYGPQKFTALLGALSPGKHTVRVEVYKYGKTFGSGSFEIEGDDYGFYAKLHDTIKEDVAENRELPPVGTTNLSLQAEMLGLATNGGWKNIRQLYIKDRDWWVEEGVGRHMAAVVVAEDGDGWFYKMVTYKQDQLLVGWGPLYITLTGDRVSVGEDKLTDTGLAAELDGAALAEDATTAARAAARLAAGVATQAADALNEAANDGAQSGEGYETSGAEKSSGPGFFYGTLKLLSRLIAGVLLALSGALLLQKRIAAMNPAAGEMVGKLVPMRPLIGLVLLGGGVLFLLINLLYLAPFADLLPDAACIVTGLYLGMDLLLKKKIEGDGDDMKAKASDAAGAAQDYLAANRGVIDKLAPYEESMGMANLVLGLLHLVAGGVLFL